MRLILLLSLFLFGGFSDDEFDYEPKYITVTGIILDFATDKPLRRKNVFINDSYYLYGKPDEFDDFDRSNFRGHFTLDTWINVNKPELHLYVKDYAQAIFINCPLDSTNNHDTIHLGAIYLAQYDNEMDEKRYNMPEEKEQPIKDLMSISQIESILKSNPDKYNMTMEIDTTEMLITRYNFGRDKPRGTTIQSFKTISFVRDMR